MEEKSTHFIFDGEKIVISPDLRLIVDFLQEIEKEIESLLGFNKNIESIEPIRSEMIALFAYLETLICLNIAYENKTYDKKTIINKAMNDGVVKFFLENFCLNKGNKWGQENLERLKHITAYDLRELRNSLTHFFSVGKNLAVSYAKFDEKSRKLEKAINFKAKFISPEDLYEIIKGAAILMIKKWSNDCLDSFNKKSEEFKEKILFVNNIIKDHGAVIIESNQINI